MSATPFDPVVSIFPCATDPDTVADCLLSEVMTRIRSDELAPVSERIRDNFSAAGGGKDGKRTVESIKRTLPGVTLAGAFDRRAVVAWREASGLVQFDLDNLDVTTLAETRRVLMGFTWVVCLWVSPSGAGLKGAVRVLGLRVSDPKCYRMAWRAVSRWLESLGLVNDPAAKDSARLAFLAHDPEAWHNPEVESFDLDRWAEPEPSPAMSRPAVVTVPDAEVECRALAYVRAMPTSIDGANGSAAMMAVVRALRDGFDLPPSSFWRALDTWNLERANPPWSRGELEHALASVEAVAPTRGRGWLWTASTEPRAAVAAAPWPAPEPLDRASDPPRFNIVDMLPTDLPELAGLVDAVAEALQVPVELVAGAAVGLTALACARAVEVQCSPDWCEPAPMWVLPLLRPGERKSASMGVLTRPFHEWMAAERVRLGEPLARYLERRRGAEARLAALRARAAKEAKTEVRAKMETEAVDLAADLESMPARLVTPDLLVQSFTPEGLRDALEANGEKLGIVSAEADAGELLGARYSDAGPNIDLLLSAHAGDPITTRRAGGRTVPLERPAVGMVLAVQPEAVRAVLADPAAKGRGLVDRMLFIHPPSRMGSRLLDPPSVPSSVSQWWACAVGSVLDLPWPGRVIIGHAGEPMRCTLPARALSLDPEARRHLWALRADLEPRLAEGADLSTMTGFASKLPGACARLALAFTILRDPKTETVGAEAMRAACAWAPFLLAHHRAVLGDAVERSELRHARRLWRALQRRGRGVMTARDLFRLVLDSALPDMEAFAPVLAVMVDHGAVRRMPRGEVGNGRPTERFAIHPNLLPVSKSDTSDRTDRDETLSSDSSDNSEGKSGAA